MIKDTKNIDVFGKNVTLVFFATSLVNFLNLIFQLFVAHSLTPQDFAALNSLISIFALLSSPLMTLQTAVAKYGAEFYATNQINKFAVLLSGLLKKAVWFALVTFCVFYLFSFQIIDKLKIPSGASGYILAVLLASSWITPILLGGIQGRELFIWLTSVVVITAVLKLILSVIFIGLGFNISGALSALLLSSLIGIAVSSLPFRGVFPLRVEKEEVPFKEIIAFVFPVAISFFCFMNLVNMDMILVKYFFNPHDSGMYSLAQMIGKIFLYLPTAISIVMLPRTSGLYAQNQDTLSTLKKSIFFAFIICIIAVLFYNFFPYSSLKVLTGKAFPESVILGRLFSVSMTFFTLTFILLTYFISIKDFRFISYLIAFTFLQFLAIVFFHKQLIQVQAILCGNSLLLFAVLTFLVRKRLKLQMN